MFLRAVYSLGDSPDSAAVDFRTASHGGDTGHLADDRQTRDPPGDGSTSSQKYPLGNPSESQDPHGRPLQTEDPSGTSQRDRSTSQSEDPPSQKDPPGNPSKSQDPHGRPVQTTNDPSSTSQRDRSTSRSKDPPSQKDPSGNPSGNQEPHGRPVQTTEDPSGSSQNKDQSGDCSSAVRGSSVECCLFSSTALNCDRSQTDGDSSSALTHRPSVERNVSSEFVNSLMMTRTLVIESEQSVMVAVDCGRPDDVRDRSGAGAVSSTADDDGTHGGCEEESRSIPKPTDESSAPRCGSLHRRSSSGSSRHVDSEVADVSVTSPVSGTDNRVADVSNQTVDIATWLMSGNEASTHSSSKSSHPEASWSSKPCSSKSGPVDITGCRGRESTSPQHRSSSLDTPIRQRHSGTPAVDEPPAHRRDHDRLGTVEC